MTRCVDQNKYNKQSLENNSSINYLSNTSIIVILKQYEVLRKELTQRLL